MKVLDLQCAHGHTFEGWFASEDDFVSQTQRAMVQCPVCGNPEVVKKLSAPRLNLAHSTDRDERAERTAQQDRTEGADQTVPMATKAGAEQALLATWLSMARQVLASTDDVGSRFAEEARKMHYQEIEARSIRGTATPDEARSLVDEGIDVIALPLPDALKGTLQ
ncbi:MAG: DUF1178 family protein [Burkholderiales bacterium]|nr:DUF1178 family protein [Burkholderiales bacterium]